MSRFVPVLAIFLFLTTAGWAETPARDTHERLHSVLWVQTSPEFEIACEEVYESAQMQLNQALDDPFWTAATEQTGDCSQLPPAVVFDIDETVLDNSPFQARLAKERIEYNYSYWQQWEDQAKAAPIPGAAHFIKYLRGRGVTPIFVSNRTAAYKDLTLKNLRQALDYPELSADQILLRKEQPNWTSDKTSRRALLATKYRILFLLGDVYDDFVDLGHVGPAERKARAQKYRPMWGRRWFLLPNPNYGNWEQALYNFDGSTPDKTVLKNKFDALQLP